MSWSLVLCEGYDDRAFWSAWLTRMGKLKGMPITSSLEKNSDDQRRKSYIQTNFKARELRGDFSYETAKGHLVVVRPFNTSIESEREQNLRSAFGNAAFRAKWFAHDFDDLFRAVWLEDRYPGVAEQLQIRLEATGAWKIAETLIEREADS